jgi:molybdopterin-guanine dinucleotide biosynthesis protein A
MARDKATLPWGDGDLLDHALRRLRAVTADVRILCGPELRYDDRGAAVLTDAVLEVGAVAALATALKALPDSGAAVLLGVDLPFVTPALLTHLVSLAAGFDAVAPISPRGAEPFAALYKASCLGPIEHAIARGDLKMTGFWRAARVREIPTSDLAAFGDPERLFMNVNAPEDYERARRL